ncbi:catalase [Pseudoalteromonas sp. NZS127_1]|uniref:putative metalloprotease CJM1_0395 family protein n=1 Tax=unclassified Pseudoalteromonas TaxID=194690 RepID=UPI0018CDB42D|nr:MULTISPECIES: putative metalloprotease CJM1_0395 family protein [unclassified Pseudoalteromonas]MBG9996508.1 catalase [Pseudoalteromonas sp. NZS127_1]MBH0039452.1 catalase [Pseudoalteromonas sp. SWN166]
MNIVTPFPSININTANVYTETARRDNQLREVIPAPASSSASNTETKAQSDAEKAKLPGNNSDVSTYDASGKLADDKAVEQREGNSENSESADQEASQQDTEQEEQLLEQEQQQIKELKTRDTEVRVHEQAHAAVGGQHAGSPSYGYERGPDGTNYAVSGEVQIDVSEVPNDPQATIDKMQTVRAAALAPAEPSGADRSIAADATQKLAAAQAELAMPEEEQSEEGEQGNKLSASETSTAESQSDTNTEESRDADVEARAGRIANFYQMTSSPQSESGFSAYG